MKSSDALEVRPANEGELEWAAQLMAGSEPWLTLGRDLEACRRVCRQSGVELHVAHRDGVPCGFVRLDPRGVIGCPYLATLAVAAEHRGQGIGSRLLEWADARFAGARHLFLCVSSFNGRARALYERHGYRQVGELPDFVVDGAAELLMVKRLRR